MCFSPYLGIWWGGGGGRGGGDGMVQHLAPAHAIFHSCSSTIEVSETYFFFCIMAIQNDHPSHVKCALARIYVFFTLFGYLVWGGGGGGL